ncbi:4-alpha-glucanotransferase [Ranunculus cassubicifolius]
MCEGCSKEMDRETKGHVLLLPFAAQGHINPVLQFGKRLASKGLKITLATTIYLSKSMHLKDENIRVELISDGFDETGPAGSESGEHFLNTMKETGSRTLTDVIKKYSISQEPFTWIVCDSILPWALDVGKEFGLVTASFYTQPCTVSSIFYHVKLGNLSVPVEEQTVSLPGLPTLALQDLPSPLVNSEETEKTALELLVAQFSNLEKADWLFFNTFDGLEYEALQLMRKLGRVRTIGPMTPSMYLDKRVEGDWGSNLNIFKPSDVNYIKWLNAREAKSVLYISFGSIAELGEEQMEELISGIKQSGKDFLWVVREKEQSKLPSGFAEEMLDKGLLVTWCSQTEVLAHEAVGCFLTHCGWNSTMEALSLGVPMVAMPHLWDQLTNAKLIADVWEIGVRVKKDDKGIVRREEIELCIREVMEGERGETIKINSMQWRKSAMEAIDVGGSSDLNIEEFVDSISPHPVPGYA